MESLFANRGDFIRFTTVFGYLRDDDCTYCFFITCNVARVSLVVSAEAQSVVVELFARVGVKDCCQQEQQQA